MNDEQKIVSKLHTVRSKNDEILINYIIELLSEMLKFKGELVTDSNIVNLFKSLDKYQIASLCSQTIERYKINSGGDLK